jgi:hypothetical protein
MTKIQREEKRVSSLKKCYAIMPNLNNIIAKAEPYIREYHQKLKAEWSKGKIDYVPTFSKYTYPSELLQLNENYKQLLKI